ncbi:hypothetical protein M5K25_021068 [Dendrobium thyrsiflorum]|uniref:Uncharacterized protein n=1 Tax=Dendrobium thyrsiflorum TaxID=117978 RepID=A0ABD0UC65_DENTH
MNSGGASNDQRPLEVVVLHSKRCGILSGLFNLNLRYSLLVVKKSRNEAKHENITMIASSIVIKIKDKVRSLFMAKLITFDFFKNSIQLAEHFGIFDEGSSRQSSKNILVRWIKPHMGCYKHNTDGAFNRSKAGCGGIIWDFTRNIVVAFAGPSKVNTAIMAEILSLNLSFLQADENENSGDKLDSFALSSISELKVPSKDLDGRLEIKKSNNNLDVNIRVRVSVKISLYKLIMSLEIAVLESFRDVRCLPSIETSYSHQKGRYQPSDLCRSYADDGVMTQSMGYRSVAILGISSASVVSRTYYLFISRTYCQTTAEYIRGKETKILNHSIRLSLFWSVKAHMKWYVALSWSPGMATGSRLLYSLIPSVSFSFHFQFKISSFCLNFNFSFRFQVSVFSLKFQVSVFSLKFQVSVSILSFRFRFQVSNFRFQVSVSISILRFQFSSFRFHVSGFRFQFQFQVLVLVFSFHFSFMFQVSVSIFRFQVSVLGFSLNFQVQVLISSFQVLVSGLRFQISVSVFGFRFQVSVFRFNFQFQFSFKFQFQFSVSDFIFQVSVSIFRFQVLGFSCSFQVLGFRFKFKFSGFSFSFRF